ncbi:MAG: DNA mismatch repair endonuclease MutL [Phycisphaeraceae bacterium]|nr:MAG: DNA mismatch repair endonuclease MutL [Phycisphaeraceae bacterium]
MAEPHTNSPLSEASSTPRIRPLPALLVNQIAAGEVVDRPASVVKELVENALDAGASRITVDLEQGGIELVRVSDDGQGISPDELPLAIAPHATSKITEAGDLDRIATLGFRGEAIASIASVSRLSIRSRRPIDTGASQIDAEGDVASPVRPASGPIGTSVTVRNLFFNTPARRKFLRTPTTEQGRCMDWLRDLAMAHPAIGFTVTNDGRRSLELPPNQSPRERVLDIIGKELEDQLIEISVDQFDDARGLALWGLIGLPSLARPTSKSQHVFLRGRVIRDRTVQHAIAEAYRGLIEPGRYPTAVLMIEMSPEAVDVNVHPAKLEVRFRDQSMVHSAVLGSIRRALQARDLTPRLSGGTGFGSFHSPTAILPGSTTGSIEPKDFVSFFKREIPAQYGAAGRLSFDALRRAIERPSPAPLTDAAFPGNDQTAPPTPLTPEASTPNALASHPHDTAGSPLAPDQLIAAPAPTNRALQVHNSFIVTQDEHGVVIVDQHALHERVMFEYLLQRVVCGPLESQPLLMPVLVEATPEQLDLLAPLEPLLTRVGIRAEPLGPRSLGIHAFPTFLFERGVDPVPFMEEILAAAEKDGLAPAEEQALHEVLDMMACKAAVKAGDKMSGDELQALLDLREDVERSSNCPHGRPTTVRITIRDLERLFGRS